MISTQRLVLIVLFINVFIGLASSAYNNLYDTTALDDLISIGNNVETNMQDTSEGGASIVTLTVNRFWNNPLMTTAKIGVTIFQIFVDGVNPFSIWPGDFTDYTEKAMAYAITLFRVIMLILLIIELYMFRTNNKVS